MNKLIIIGNGFDLHHGLPTGYTDFIKWLIRKYLERAIEVGSISTPLFFITAEKKHEVKNIIGSSPVTNEQIEAFIKDLSIVLDATYYYHFECTLGLYDDFGRAIVRSMLGKNWVDIELEYFEQLKMFIFQYQDDKSLIADIKLEGLNSSLSFLTDELKIYLLEVSSKGQANERYGTIAENPIPISIIPQHEFVSQLPDEVFEDASTRSRIKTDAVLFLNFNYTTLPRDLYDRHQKFSHINIHGTILNDQNPIVFGYGDEVGEEYARMEKTNNNGFLQFVKSFAYPQNGNYRDLTRFIDSAPFIVYIWGHSCALSDRTLLNMIFEHDNCFAIQPFYWKKDDGTDNYTDLIQNLSRHFRDKQKFRNRLINKEDCNPL
jgi:hypothetical protein